MEGLSTNVAENFWQNCVVRFRKPSSETPREFRTGSSGFLLSPNGSAENDDHFSGLSIRSAIGEPRWGVEMVVSDRMGA